MYTIIGLGSAGCNIAELFEQEGYKVKLIDVGIEGENCFCLKEQKTPELYESNVPDLSIFFNDVTEKIILIVGGGGKISGATLQILKQLKHKELNIVYIKPEERLISSLAKLQDRVAYNILQEYARSGVFKNIYLFSNPVIENMIGDAPIVEFKERMNKVIFNALNAHIKFNNMEALIDNAVQPKEISRIVTFGLYDMQNNEEVLFFPINFIDDKCYYFAINENELKSNGKLFKMIKDSMLQKVLEQTKISYKIYSTPHEHNYCYVVAYSRKIQE